RLRAGQEGVRRDVSAGGVLLYDTTLRDGAQSEDISFSVADKLRIAQALDELGIAYVEGGWPGSNPRDEEFFAAARELRPARGRLDQSAAGRARGRSEPACAFARGDARRDHLRQGVGPARAEGAFDFARAQPGAGARHRRVLALARGRGRLRRRAFLRRLEGK